MSERVIDRLHAVEIEQHDRARVPVAAGARPELVQLVFEATPAEQSGERVAVGERVELRLQRAAPAVGVAQGSGTPLDHSHESCDRGGGRPPGSFLIAEQAPVNRAQLQPAEHERHEQAQGDHPPHDHARGTGRRRQLQHASARSREQQRHGKSEEA